MSERQRIDIWLFRARLTKTRAEAARLAAEGALRLLRDAQSRRVDKASTEVTPGDAVLVTKNGVVRGFRVLALGSRRGPPAEARRLHLECPGA